MNIKCEVTVRVPILQQCGTQVIRGSSDDSLCQHMPAIASNLCRQLPGARAVIAQHAPQVTYSTRVVARYSKQGYSVCTPLFGRKVDEWLSQAVHHGWLDWGASECDLELQMALAAKDGAACAAQAIWEALVARGFVAVHCQETVPSLQLGVAPVLDLRGFNARGELTIVEVKCGWAHSNSQGTLQLHPPYEHINCNHRNLALLQLAMQVHCMQETTRAKHMQSLQTDICSRELKLKNAWLLTLGSRCNQYETAVYHLQEDMLAVARQMVEQLNQRQRKLDTSACC